MTARRTTSGLPITQRATLASSRRTISESMPIGPSILTGSPAGNGEVVAGLPSEHAVPDEHDHEPGKLTADEDDESLLAAAHHANAVVPEPDHECQDHEEV